MAALVRPYPANVASCDRQEATFFVGDLALVSSSPALPCQYTATISARSTVCWPVSGAGCKGG